MSSHTLDDFNWLNERPQTKATSQKHRNPKSVLPIRPWAPHTPRPLHHSLSGGAAAAVGGVGCGTAGTGSRRSRVAAGGGSTPPPRCGAPGCGGWGRPPAAARASAAASLAAGTATSSSSESFRPYLEKCSTWAQQGYVNTGAGQAGASRHRRQMTSGQYAAPAVSKIAIIIIITSITPFGATNGASEIVSLARAKLRPGTSN